MTVSKQSELGQDIPDYMTLPLTIPHVVQLGTDDRYVYKHSVIIQ